MVDQVTFLNCVNLERALYEGYFSNRSPIMTPSQIAHWVMGVSYVAHDSALRRKRDLTQLSVFASAVKEDVVLANATVLWVGAPDRVFGKGMYLIEPAITRRDKLVTGGTNDEWVAMLAGVVQNGGRVSYTPFGSDPDDAVFGNPMAAAAMRFIGGDSGLLGDDPKHPPKQDFEIYTESAAREYGVRVTLCSFRLQDNRFITDLTTLTEQKGRVMRPMDINELLDDLQ